MPKTVKKTGVNDPCPCGSGNKFKKCCGKQSTSNQSTSQTARVSGLCQAAAVGDVESARRLLAAGAAVDDTETWGFTPLQWFRDLAT